MINSTKLGLAVLTLTLGGTIAWTWRQRPESTRAPFKSNREPVVADWPRLFGAEYDSRSAETGLNFEWGADGPPLAWRMAIGSGYSAPVAARSLHDINQSDLVLLHREGNKEVLSCRDAASGKERWQIDWSTTYKCRYEYSSGPYATPVIDGDLVYAVGAQGQLHCVDRQTGELVWHRFLAEDFSLTEGLFGFGAGILVDDERLYLNVGGVDKQAGVASFDKRTGETLWTATDRGWAYTTPRIMAVGPRKILLVLTEFGLAALDPHDGNLLAEYEFHPRGPDVINAVTPAVFGEHVLLTIGPGPGSVCLRTRVDADGIVQWEEVWRDRRTLDSQFNNLVLHMDRQGQPLIYGFTASQQGGATLRCVEMLTGKLRWKFASDLGRGQSLWADEHLIVLGERGQLAALRDAGRAIQTISHCSEAQFKPPCYSQPALHRGRLYIRNEHEIVCFDIRQNAVASTLKPMTP